MQTIQQNSNLDLIEIKALWQAVLLQAIIDIKSTPQAKEAAIKWVKKEKKDFEMVCYLGGLNPEKERENILKLIKRIQNGK
ncbi:MAG: hypothetical protein COV55_02965 [Candidatus Komeilibacteria bacterium CG11_big_fil_rev_8_21_14_0_20_36_20]|uniref:Uncharacterized protein n=1 Tax=Candidatus Komeilibacteria bacterium CG11_big_fil_rev_8_21_14_0_20_36_20 TaxID=1974477 RepID=A0A2H0NCR8_9BACT|nr:MAG: hypothetical protein COV55_02965 [Candidatus Komeilibacteria bacterium CG11_big_fil_rev_8_21_14_0_20_36_20]